MTTETKLQIEALKMLEKGEKIPSCAKDDKYFFLTFDGIHALRIYNKSFWLNPESMKEATHLPQHFSVDKLSGTSELTATDEMKKLSKGAVGVLLKGDDFTTCIYEKHLKLFMDKSCKLYAKDEKSAVYFTHNEEIYAVVMPVQLKPSKAQG